jgi:hypothetical protein
MSQSIGEIDCNKGQKSRIIYPRRRSQTGKEMGA